MADRAIELTPQEFSLLFVLAQAATKPVSRNELLHRAWPDAIDNPRTVDTHVLSLRKKLERDPRQPRLIQTVRNVGYRFQPEAVDLPHEERPSPVQPLAVKSLARPAEVAVPALVTR